MHSYSQTFTDIRNRSFAEIREETRYLLAYRPLSDYIPRMDQPSPAKVPTCIGLPPDLRDRMDAAAEAMERPRSWVAAKAIREYLDRQAAAQQDTSP